jgi:hypothetical protein
LVTNGALLCIAGGRTEGRKDSGSSHAVSVLSTIKDMLMVQC